MRITRHLTYTLYIFYTLFGSAQLHAQKVDEIYNQKIKEYTTDKRFLPSSVLNLMDDPIIPSPLKYFGAIVGAPGLVHHSTEIYGYYKKLASLSPLITIQQVGSSEEGRPMNLVVIGSEETMKQTDQYRKQLALLADPRKIKEADLDQILKNAKPVYFLNGGLHSTEMGSPETLMELAYRLITDNSEAIKKIRENIIVIINPVCEPDGRDKMVDYYYRYSKSRKEFDDGYRHSPPYWGKYAFHDNNRDGIQASQMLTRTTYNIYYDWHPTVMLDLHEPVPLMAIGTGTGPYNDFIDPINISEWQEMANHDVTALAAQGLPGAFTWAYTEGWYPGFIDWIANNHNSVGRFYETFGNSGANTYLRDLSEETYAGDSVTSKQWYRPDPATQLVNWSFRDNINYTEAGVLAALSYTANNATVLLRNFYQKGLNSINKGKNEKIKAFVIPAEQHDPVMAAYLVNQLRKQRIEVHVADMGKNKMDYIVLLDQPYRNLAVSLLTKQAFPKDAKFPPYDDIAWTLGYLYGVDVRTEDSVKYSLANLKLLSDDVQYVGQINGIGENYILNYKGQNTLLPALYWLKSENKDASAFITDGKSKVEGMKDSLSAGSVLFKGLSTEQAKKLTTQFGLDLQATHTGSVPKQHMVNLPRIAIYHTWYNTQDVGWARFTFDQMGIPYTYINKDDLKEGGLRKRFDVILIPRTFGTASNFINEIDRKFSPMPYTKTAEFPSHGFPDSTSDMTGGPGFVGMEQLRQFAETGGVIISLDNSSQILVSAGIGRELDVYDAPGLFHPGSVVNVKVRSTNSPIVYGFPEVFPIFRGICPVLQVRKFNRDMMLLQYGTKPL
ncbi:MAG TPA: M14 family zinc carboxypeptidase, partial [Puia sp.]